MTKHNKHYYDKGRNGWTPTTTWQDEVVEDKDNKWSGGKINPKMLLTKEELMLDYSKKKHQTITLVKFMDMRLGK